MIVNEEGFVVRYGQHIFASACFWPTKKASGSVVMLKVENGEWLSFGLQ